MKFEITTNRRYPSCERAQQMHDVLLVSSFALWAMLIGLYSGMIGVSVATLRNWEQGRRTPDGPALALLRVAARNPKAVIQALHTEPKRGATGNIGNKVNRGHG